ncbi:hypothetical protein ATANTOWER_022078 [Ataeniobius toweri]|uniref:Uncharacterized protein n=1 Tax=Ataeniobius toweri TaxID=208326 RepID=A0ABU7C8X3_9TELE|nr:hypothetical protein [Ataeniobius toweri]
MTKGSSGMFKMKEFFQPRQLTAQRESDFMPHRGTLTHTSAAASCQSVVYDDSRTSLNLASHLNRQNWMLGGFSGEKKSNTDGLATQGESLITLLMVMLN